MAVLLVRCCVRAHDVRQLRFDSEWTAPHTTSQELATGAPLAKKGSREIGAGYCRVPFFGRSIANGFLLKSSLGRYSVAVCATPLPSASTNQIQRSRFPSRRFVSKIFAGEVKSNLHVRREKEKVPVSTHVRERVHRP